LAMISFQGREVARTKIMMIEAADVFINRFARAASSGLLPLSREFLLTLGSRGKSLRFGFGFWIGAIHLRTGL
ncbi:hypothetical protein U5801_29295, partial [Lamprobacter modestohalophilus]|uniref:hypothetical protein n=1 Tax=Lamprobacter modestohalophilus TaxID=1064514 RepID=UPI002ADEB030